MLTPRLFIPYGIDAVTCKGINYTIGPDRTIQPLNDEHYEMLTSGAGYRAADEGSPQVVPEPAEPTLEELDDDTA